jgi:hypothetical protein
MQTSGLDWIDDLPPELAGQQALLRGLLALCDADNRIRWLVIGCSLARGAGDRLSDLDLAMGIRDEDFDAARPGLRRAVDGLGELIESYHHQLPSVTQAHACPTTSGPPCLRRWPSTSPPTSNTCVTRFLRNLCRSHVAERRECGIRALSPGLSGSLCVPAAMGSDDVVTFLGRWERSVRS